MKNYVTGDVIYDVIDGLQNFPPSLVHSLNVFLQDVGSGKSVSCIVWGEHSSFNLHPKASPILYTLYIYIIDKTFGYLLRGEI